MSLFPIGRNQCRGKHPPPAEVARATSLVPHSLEQSIIRRCQGRQDPSLPLVTTFPCSEGRQDPFLPLATVFLCCQGRRGPSPPLVTTFPCCQGRRDPSPPLGNDFSMQRGASGPFSALGNCFSLLRGALGTLTAPLVATFLFPEAAVKGMPGGKTGCESQEGKPGGPGPL